MLLFPFSSKKYFHWLILFKNKSKNLLHFRNYKYFSFCKYFFLCLIAFSFLCILDIINILTSVNYYCTSEKENQHAICFI